MKKNFKYMLVALLAVFGFSAAMAIISPEPGQNMIEVDYYKYKITKMPTAGGANGTVTLVGLTDAAKAEANYSDLHITNGVLSFPESVTYSEGGKDYTFNVTKMEPDAFKNVCLNAKSVTIPQYLEEIPTAAFNTLTRLTTLTFAEGSQLKKIGNQAFASTNISNFDFKPCTKLPELPDEVFIEAWEPTELQPTNPNTNSVITTIALPTGSNFKHINGALRSLTSLTTINLKDTWVREIVDGAFAGCAFTELELPGKDLLYISGNAFAGCEHLATLTISADKLIQIGGGRVKLADTYVEDVSSIKDKYEWVQSEYLTNLYGFSALAEEAAPLVTLSLTNSEGKTFEGKINKNAFAWCDNMDGLDLTKLNFGTESQIKEHAFFDCDGITVLTIGDIRDNQLGQGQYTIDKNAFEGCPIETLKLGDILTVNAIGSAAFGNSLVNVTIGTVDAGDKAFAPGTTTIAALIDEEGNYNNEAGVLGAFVFANETETTLNLAWNAEELGYLSSQTPATKTIIPAGAFDFSAVTGLDEDGEAISGFEFPVLNIGELKSQGGIFAEGAFIGKDIAAVNFKGNINTNGLNTHFIATVTERVAAQPAVYEMGKEDVLFDEVPDGANLVEDAEEAEPGDFVRSGDKYKMVFTAYAPAVAEVSVEVTEEQKEAMIGDGMAAEEDFLRVGDNTYKYVIREATEGNDVVYMQKDSEVERKVYRVLPEGVEEGDPLYPRADPEGYWHILVPASDAADLPVNTLNSVTFEGEIKTKGITNKTNNLEAADPDPAKGPFSNFPGLVTVTFNGMLSENAVDANTFINSIDATAEGQMITYDVDEVDDPSVNPFNSNAFADAETGKGENRVLNWTVADGDLSDLINHAILQNEGIDEEDAEIVDIMYNVYKWKPVKDDNPKDGGFFVIYQDYKTSLTHQNPDPTMAWGRYDLGSFKETFAVRPGYDENQEEEHAILDDETGDVIDYEVINPTANQASDMLIDRIQTITQKDAQGNESELTYKLTLYGVYNDEDPIEKKSTVYMVPLQVFNGQYAIPEENTHLIIAKAVATEGTITDPDVKVYYTTDIDGKNSVWDQLQGATYEADADADNYRVFKKSDDTWTNQELNNAIIRHLGGDAPDVDGAEIWIMTDPSKYRGFRVDRNKFVASTPTSDGAFIAEGWYFALLNSYAPAQSARVIWLDEAEATAIFDVKDIKVKDALQQNDGAIYNLQGIRVSKPGKGLYIQNGKKFVVK